MHECKLVGRPEWSKPHEWANPSVMDYEDMDDSEIEFIESIYDQLKKEMSISVNEYVGDFEEVDNLLSTDPYEPYPNKFEMSGDYYINHASCYKDTGEYIYSFSVELLCKPEARTAQNAKSLAYHGLEVLLIIDASGNIKSDGVVSSWGS